MIDTPRLLIRPFQEQDGHALFEYLSDPSVYRFEPGEPVSLDQAKELAAERSKGTDFWAVILKSNQALTAFVFQTDRTRKI